MARLACAEMEICAATRSAAAMIARAGAESGSLSTIGTPESLAGANGLVQRDAAQKRHRQFRRQALAAALAERCRFRGRSRGRRSSSCSR
jgi:hypothetical protein